MAVSAMSAARRICSRSNWTLTNLQLQKILYIAHMLYMGQTGGQRLVSTPFQAWDYGPVEPQLYSRVRIFGDKPIQDVFFAAPPITDPREAAILDVATDRLSRLRPSQLVAMTHRPNGAWAKNYKAGIHGIVIPDSDILAEFAGYSRSAVPPIPTNATPSGATNSVASASGKPTS